MAIFDATNSTEQRRQLLVRSTLPQDHELISSAHGPGCCDLLHAGIVYPITAQD